jgi:hypothetical protein
LSKLLRPPLCAALWRRRALLALERGQHELAADCLERAALAAPRHPALGPLEVLLLLETGAPERAAELAREWCRRLEEQGIALGDDYAFLREVARGPAVSSRARAADLADDLSVR